MTQHLSVATGVVIGLLVGGGSVYLKLHHQTTPVAPTPLATSAPAPAPAQASGNTVSPSANPFTLSPPVATSLSPGTTLAPSGTGQPAKPAGTYPATPDAASQANDSPIPGIHFDATQKEQFAALRRDVQQKMAAIQANKSLSMSEAQTKRNAVIEEADHTLTTKILTPSQQKIFQAQRKHEQEEMARAQQAQRQAAADAQAKNSGLPAGEHLTPEQQRIAAVHAQALQDILRVTNDPKYGKEGREYIIKQITLKEQNDVLDILNPGRAKPTPVPVKLGPPSGKPTPAPAPVKPAPGATVPAPK